MIFMPFKYYLIVLTLLLLSFFSNAQYPNNEIKPYEPPVFSRYNAVTLGSQVMFFIISIRFPFRIEYIQPPTQSIIKMKITIF